METAKEELEEKVILEERMIRELYGNGGKLKIETLMYFGSLNLEELID